MYTYNFFSLSISLDYGSSSTYIFYWRSNDIAVVNKCIGTIFLKVGLINNAILCVIFTRHRALKSSIRSINRLNK